ncbi:MAG: penicillin-binding protein 2 [Pseudomonadota bacterium]
MSLKDAFDSADAQGLRARLIGFCAALVFVGIAAKAGLVALAGEPRVGGVSAAFEAPVRRADIVDRNGELLATSVTVYSLFADPRAIWDPEDVAQTLGAVFDDIDVDALTARLSNRERAFEWVRRGLTPRQRQTVNTLGLEGLGFREESRRAYPRGTLAGHVLGYSGLDGNGLGGIEFALQDRLAEGGAPVQLTLHSGVQFALEAEIAAAASEHDAEGGAGIVLHPRSGEIYAMASWPPIDPNRASELPSDDPARLNRAVTAVYELGSVFKPLTVAAGIETGAVTPSDAFDVREPLVIRGASIEDDHPVRGGRADLTDIIADSSNIGTVKVAIMLGERRQRAFLESLGLFRRAPVELAGSAAPLIPKDWDDLSSATVSFGHGMAVSPIAFVSAFGVLANGGELAPPTLVMDARTREPRRVLSAPTAALVVAMMREAVTRGTGERAEVAGYRVAGKTGTAEKPIPGGYAEDRNVTSFAAVFPADGPEYVVFIVLDEPEAAEAGGMTAAWNAAPAAGRVIERIAPILGVAPDFESRSAPTPAVRSVADRRTSL